MYFWTNEKIAKTLSNLVNEGNKFHFNASAFTGFSEQTDKVYQPLTLEDKTTLKQPSLIINCNEKEKRCFFNNYICKNKVKKIQIMYINNLPNIQILQYSTDSTLLIN